MNTLIGRIVYIGAKERITDKFCKQMIAIRISEGAYPEEVPIEFINESIEQLKGAKVGMDVTVSFDTTGRRWEKDGETRWFASNRGRSVEIYQTVDDAFGEEEELPGLDDAIARDRDLPVIDDGDDLPF